MTPHPPPPLPSRPRTPRMRISTNEYASLCLASASIRMGQQSYLRVSKTQYILTAGRRPIPHTPHVTVTCAKRPPRTPPPPPYPRPPDATACFTVAFAFTGSAFTTQHKLKTATAPTLMRAISNSESSQNQSRRPNVSSCTDFTKNTLFSSRDRLRTQGHF